MRKHFLLLFLMAVLPLAGWADEVATSVEGFTAVFETPMTYNGGEQAFPVPSKLTRTGYEDIVAGISTSNWKNAANEPVEKITDAGTYTCTVQASGKTGTITGTFTVAKFTVTITPQAIPTGTAKITFGDTKESVEAMFSVNYSAKPAGLTTAQWTAQKTAFNGQLAYTPTYEQWATIPGSGKFTYAPDITALQATFTNYTFTPVAADITMTAKDMKNNMFTIKDAIYTANGYTPNADNKGLTLKDQERNQTMAEGTDYTIKYYGALNTDGDDVTGDELAAGGLKNVGTYYAKIFGKGNYSTTSFVIAEFNVTQRPLSVTTTGANKVYGDDLAVPALTDASYNGFQTPTGGVAETFATAARQNGITKMLTKLQKDGVDVNTTIPLAVGTYDVVAYPAKTVSSEDVPVEAGLTEIFVNYRVAPFYTGKYVVSQKAITFALKAQEKTTGIPNPLENAEGVQITAANASKYLTLPTLVAGDEYEVYPIVKLNGDKTKVTADLTNVKIRRNISTTSVANYIDVTDNYDLKKTEANYTSVAGTLLVQVTSVTRTYDGNKKLSNENAALELTILDGTADDIAYAMPRIKAAYSISETSKDGLSKFPNAGTYDITFDPEKLDLGDLKDAYTVDAFPGTYTINKHAIKELKAADLTYAVGELATAYTPNASNVTITMNDNDEYVLTDTDKRILFSELTFKFADAITGDGDGMIVDNTTKKIKDGKENSTANDGVELSYVTLTNFTVATSKAGKLTVSKAATAGADLFDRNQVDNLATGADESFYATFVKDNDGKKLATVRFKNFATPLKAQKWNTLVLPFDITVAKLSQALGYALVNVLNEETTTASDIRFKVEMGTIPANTPFLVKTAEEVDMNQVVIRDVVVKKSSTNKPVIDLSAKGVKFYGLYVAKTGLAANERTVSNDTWIIDNSKATLKPLAAYLETENAGARIFVEDLDENGTTAIKELNMSTMVATAVDGWFTLNGVKLQGMPTEKGIYINNGKKVVIK